eukprot:gene6137-6757_t
MSQRNIKHEKKSSSSSSSSSARVSSSSSQLSHGQLGYRRGSILRVRMKNFLTYDDCEVAPGPKLNVVIGPNGTGKSALTHAICLACCGSTGDIGRSSDLSKFVKQGKEEEECFVEVEIVLNDVSSVIIRRSLNSENRGSRWFRNNQLVKQSEIKELMNELSIDVDNLCSFMPQDRVGLFSQFSAKEILQETLKSINLDLEGNAALNNTGKTITNLYEEQVALSDQENVKEAKRRERESKLAAYNNISQQIAKMATEIDRLAEREKAEELQSYLEIKLTKVRAVAVANNIKAKESEIEDQHQALNTLRKAFGPLEEEERSVRRSIQQANRQLDGLVAAMESLVKQLNAMNRQVNDGDVEIDKAATRIVNQERLKVQEEQKLQKLTSDLQSLQKQSQEVSVSLETIREDLNDNKSKQSALQDRRQDEEGTQRALNGQLKEKIEQIKAVEREMNTLQDSRQVFFHRLQRLSQSGPQDRLLRDTVQAMEFFRDHEDRLRREGKLTGPIFGPVALYLTVKDPACVVMLEKAIPLNRLMGFVTLNDQDSRFLKQEVRDRMGLRIDIYTMNNVATNHPLPYDASYLRHRVHNQMEIAYLSEQVVCPDEIRAYLYTFCALHAVLWTRTSQQITNDVLQGICPTGVNTFKLYVHDTRTRSSGGGDGGMKIIEYSGRRSRYATNLPPSTASSLCYPRNILSAGKPQEVDDKRQELLERRQDIQNEVTRIEQSLRATHSTLSSINNELLALNASKNKLVDALRQPDSIKQKMKMVQERIRDVQKALDEDRQHGQVSRMKAYVKAVDGVLRVVQDYNDMMQKHYDIQIKQQCFTTVKNVCETRVVAIEQQLADFREQERGFQQAISTLTTQRNALTATFKRYEGELKKMALDHGGEEAFVRQVYPRILELCPENDEEALENRLITVTAQINAIVDNPLLRNRYDEMLAEQEELQKELNELNDEFENIESVMKERLEEWLKIVRSLADKLHKSFSSYMSKLLFEGQVVLRETGRLMDYELLLRVAFRQGAPCADLSGQRHSGGERAVSTVMYLMALQDMTSAPFRVVDEINQGMDERNERLVMDRIVQTCCDSSPTHARPQYFLVTPKLLQGLKALNHDDVTILLVWNGPGILNYWNFDDVLQTLRKRVRREGAVETKAASEDEEEEEDEKPINKRRLVKA